MKVSRAQPAYTIEPLVTRNTNHQIQHNPAPSTASTLQTGTSQLKESKALGSRQGEDTIGQLFDLENIDISGTNTTICEYVNILTQPDCLLTEEALPSSLNFSWNGDCEDENKGIRNVTEAIMGRREGYDQLLELQRLRARSINLLEFPACNMKLTPRSETPIETRQTVGTLDEKDKEADIKKNIHIKKIGKIVIPTKTKIVDTKKSTKQPLSKIAIGSFNNLNSLSSSTSASVTARKFAEEYSSTSRSKGAETGNLTSRIMTPRTDRDVYHTSNAIKGLVKPTIQIGSPQPKNNQEKKSTQQTQTSLAEKYKGTLKHRNSHSSQISFQPSNYFPQTKYFPSQSVSRNVQAIVTPRGVIAQKEEDQKSLAPIMEEYMQNGKKTYFQFDNKIKKDTKNPKHTKANLEVNISRKSVQRKREERINECVESLDEIYENLRRAIIEKQEGIAHNGHCIQKIESLRNYMKDTLACVNNIKFE